MINFILHEDYFNLKINNNYYKVIIVIIIPGCYLIYTINQGIEYELQNYGRRISYDNLFKII